MDQVLDYIYYLKESDKTPSESTFKHLVYGLRALYKLHGMDWKRISLPQIQRFKHLPVILSKEEVKLLLSVLDLQKHRLIFSFLYDCGLRVSELLNIELKDINFDRKQVHIRQSKGNKDRYVTIGNLLLKGIRTYLELEKPTKWLFYRYDNHGILHQYSKSGVQYILRQATKKAGLQKHVTSHCLRHSNATHLLEMGLDIMSLKDALGHSSIQTTMKYLHIGQIERKLPFSPLDKIYDYPGEKDKK